MQADELDLDSHGDKLDDHVDQLIKPEVKLPHVNPTAVQQASPDSSNKCDDALPNVNDKSLSASKSGNVIDQATHTDKEADRGFLPVLSSEQLKADEKTETSESPEISPSALSTLSGDSPSLGSAAGTTSTFASSEDTPSKPAHRRRSHSHESASPSRKGFETEESPKRVSQVDDLKRKGRAFFQGIVENFTAPPISRTTSGDSEEQSVQREIMIKEDRASWKNLLQNWTSKTDAPSQKKLRSMCWRGIPSSCRGEAWFAIIGNDLKITRDLYKILSSRTKSLTVDASSKEDSASLIEVDAPRTFPELKFFHGDGPLRAPLVNILKTYVSFRPDVGYIQGMSYIAAMLLLNLDDECNAFISLANLLNRELYFTLFRDFQSGRAHLNVFDKLLQKHVPRCAQKFKELQLTSDMYLYDWILTIFSRSFPLDIACRIWDCFLVYGQVFMFRAALGVLKMYERAFLQSNFEQCLLLLNRIPRNMDETVLFQSIHSISISDKSLNAMLAKVQTVS